MCSQIEEIGTGVSCSMTKILIDWKFVDFIFVCIEWENGFGSINLVNHQSRNKMLWI